MKRVIFIRHGQSVWNEANRFTGWADVDLTEAGIQEAHKAGQKLKESGIELNMAFTSVLKRVTLFWKIQSSYGFQKSRLGD